MITERPDGGYDLAMRGFVVNQCIVDFAFSLSMVRPEHASRDQESALLRIEGAFECALGGEPMRFNPAQGAVALGPALALFRRTVEYAAIELDGSLRLMFTDGASLRVPVDPDYEAWTLNLPGGMLIVAEPGGGVAIFERRKT